MKPWCVFETITGKIKIVDATCPKHRFTQKSVVVGSIPKTRKREAHLIVQAVNSYDAAVELANSVLVVHGNITCSNWERDLVEQAREVLRLIEEKQ